MIGWPRHLADDGAFVDGASDEGADAVPHVDGVDLEAAAHNVDRLGGSRRTFEGRVSAAHAAGARDPELLRAAVALAAWRAGVLALRDDALDRLQTLAKDREGRSIAGAALRLDADRVVEFVSRQAEDRFWWPDRDRWNGYVCAVGGFAGLGGAWIEPPQDGRTVIPVAERAGGGPPRAAPAASGPAAFAVRTGDEWWRLDADVWGSRLTRTGDSPVPSAAVHTSRASLVTRPDSYLAWVHVRDAA